MGGPDFVLVVQDGVRGDFLEGGGVLKGFAGGVELPLAPRFERAFPGELMAVASEVRNLEAMQGAIHAIVVGAAGAARSAIGGGEFEGGMGEFDARGFPNLGDFRGHRIIVGLDGEFGQAFGVASALFLLKKAEQGIFMELQAEAFGSRFGGLVLGFGVAVLVDPIVEIGKLIFVEFGEGGIGATLHNFKLQNADCRIRSRIFRGTGEMPFGCLSFFLPAE